MAILLEVEFVRLYEDQPLFGDVNEFLVDQGFDLIRLDTPECTRVRGPIGSRGRGQMLFGDALYFRRPGRGDDIALAFAALAFGLTELAIECLPVPANDLQDPKHLTSWLRIVQEFQSLVLSDLTPTPPTFTDLYSCEASARRFDPTVTRSRLDDPTIRTSTRSRLTQKMRLGIKNNSPSWTRPALKRIRRGWRVRRLAALQAQYISFAKANGLNQMRDALVARRQRVDEG